MNMMAITPKNRKVDLNTLNIVRESFEEQKGIKILSIYSKDNDIYGVYIAPLNQLLSFIEQPLYSMSTDIDGHNIFMMELGSLLHLIYHNGSIQMYQWLIHKSDIDISYHHFDKLLEYCEANPPYDLAKFHLIKWIDELNDGNLNMSTFDLVDMVKIFMENEPLDIDFDDNDSEIILKNKLNKVSQELKSKKYNKISERIMRLIDKEFINLQIDLYISDNK